MPSEILNLAVSVLATAIPMAFQGGAHARAAGDQDTARTYPMPEVVVTATRSALSLSRSPSRVTVLSRESIENGNGSSLGVLLRDVPGLLIREYGAGGALQTVSFRGMAAEQTLVLLDGVPVNNVQLGLADLRLLPIDQIDRVELVRGGGSGLWGANALGGVIDILTGSSSPGANTSVEASTGSFGASRFAVRTSASPGQDWRLTAGGSTETAAGNYPFVLRQDGVETEAIRSNSDHRAYDVFLKSGWRSPAGGRANVLLSFASLDRGTPGPFLTVQSQSSARQADDQVQAIGSFASPVGERLELQLSGDIEDAYEHYADFLGLFPADNYYRNITFGLRPQLRYEPGPSSALLLGVELGRAIADGNALEEEQVQSRLAVSAASELQVDSIGRGASISLYPSLRYDRVTGVEDSWSPRVGLNLRASAGGGEGIRATLHSTAGRDFRIPTFNELYYAGAGGHGNRALLPERSVSFDAGATLEWLWAGSHELDGTYYSITTAERIFWQPAGSEFDWSPVNIGETKSTGAEFEYRWDLPGRTVELTGNYSLLNARKKFSSGTADPTYDKQLIYVPLETGSFGALMRLPIRDRTITGVRIRVAGEYVGERFIVEDNTLALPSYVVLAGTFGMDIRVSGGVQLHLQYSVDDIADEPYEVIPRYPMPMRSHTISISLSRTEEGKPE